MRCFGSESEAQLRDFDIARRMHGGLACNLEDFSPEGRHTAPSAKPFGGDSLACEFARLGASVAALHPAASEDARALQPSGLCATGGTTGSHAPMALQEGR